MPRLWDDTIEAHRRSVRDAILETAAALVRKGGLRSVTMSQVAEQAGIGRATLYRYFPDVDAMLLAWHERQVMCHLEQLGELRRRPGTAGERLTAVLEAYAFIRHESTAHARHGGRTDHGPDMGALLHRADHMHRAQRQLSEFLRDLVHDAAEAGEVRADVPPGELATYCLHALAAAASLPSKTAVGRLVAVTLDGLRPPGR